MVSKVVWTLPDVKFTVEFFSINTDTDVLSTMRVNTYTFMSVSTHYTISRCMQLCCLSVQ